MTSANTHDPKGEMKRAAARVLARGGTQSDVASLLYNGWGVKLDGYEPPKESARTPGMVEGIATNALQGVTFGYGDEAVGSIIGLLTGKGAQGGIDEYRAEMQKFNEANPGTALASEIGGGLLLGGTGAARTLGAKGAAMGLGGKMAMGGAVGGGAGAVYGSGNAEGGLSERAKGAVFGGVAGATVGTAIPVVGAAVGAAVKPVANVAAPWLDKMKRQPKGATASKSAREMAADAIARDYRGDWSAAEREMERLIKTGAPVTFADVVKANGDDLFKAATALRGPGKQRVIDEVMTRQADQPERIAARLFRSLRLGISNAYDAADDVLAQRKAVSQPLYERAYTQETKVTPELQKLLNHPRFQKAYDTGRLIASDEDLAGVGNSGALKVPPLAVDKSGKFVGQTIPVRALDYMKRGLDHAIEQAQKGQGGALDRQSARSLRKLLNDALDAVEDVPEYKRARSVWRGETEMLEALQMGKGGSPLSSATDVKAVRFVNRPPEVIKRELADLTPAEQEMYRLGAAQDIAEMLASLTAEAPDAAKKLGGKVYGNSVRQIEKRVRELFADPDMAEEFMDYVSAEARLSKTASNLPTRGSQTAGLQQGMADLSGRGGVMRQMADATITPLVSRAKTGWTEAISDEVANVALKGLNGPDELRMFFHSLKPVAPKYRPTASLVAGQQVSQVR